MSHYPLLMQLRLKQGSQVSEKEPILCTIKMKSLNMVRSQIMIYINVSKLGDKMLKLQKN